MSTSAERRSAGQGDTRDSGTAQAWILARSCANRTREVSSQFGIVWDLEVSATPIVPVQRAPFASKRPNDHLFTRWVEAEGHQLASYRHGWNTESSRLML